jgi:hypothetical protein
MKLEPGIILNFSTKVSMVLGDDYFFYNAEIPHVLIFRPLTRILDHMRQQGRI